LTGLKVNNINKYPIWLGIAVLFDNIALLAETAGFPKPNPTERAGRHGSTPGFEEKPPTWPWGGMQ
jgi:hypothetical protein